MSAAVDRTHRINSAEFSTANPDRWHVLREAWGASVAYRGLCVMLVTRDHAGAIAYADHMAREEASRD